MKIEWVNHASFIIEHDGVRLMTDPWLEGRAFDHGWAHLVPTTFRYPDFATITHVWVSHEHPDHFAPKNLLAIPAEIRARITLMFHEGVDFRIGTFCRNAGFGEVVQLKAGRWHRLANDLRIKCEEASGDTWLAVRSHDTTLLNLNDSIFAYQWRIAALRRKVGAPIDVLMSQYSYANWVGNPDQPEKHRQAAAEMLDRLRTQMAILQPRYAIPFASMVRFCHTENAYLNEAMNHVGAAHDVIAESATTPIVLYPGETWNVGALHDSQASIERYRPHYEAVARQTDLVESPSVPIPELARLADRFWRTIRRRNPPWTLWLAQRAGRLEPARIWLWDHAAAVELSADGGLTEIDLAEGDCDVAMGSESLQYQLRYLWGGSTVQINGRYRAPPGGAHGRWVRLVNLATLNNRGWTLVRYATGAVGRQRDKIERRLRARRNQA